MLLEHPLLATLPRLSLDAPEPTRYRAIRAARRPDQLSTLEATVHALGHLEGPTFDAKPLLDAFGRFVTSLAHRQRTNPNGLPPSIVDNDRLDDTTERAQRIVPPS